MIFACFTSISFSLTLSASRAASAFLAESSACSSYLRNFSAYYFASKASFFIFSAYYLRASS